VLSMTKVNCSDVRPGMFAAAVLSLAVFATDAIARERPVTVVELFTSQGCSACPPGIANLAALSERPGVLALSFGVTYWDRLGWKDTFADPLYTERQAQYEAPLGQAGPFTPQIVVNWQVTVVGSDLSSIERLIASSPRPATASITLDERTVTIGAGAAPREGADIWQVHYDPSRVDVVVRRGENRGRTLPDKNVVHDLQLIGTWTGQPGTVRRTQTRDGLRPPFWCKPARAVPYSRRAPSDCSDPERRWLHVTGFETAS
jgi:hypothetical protein